MSSDFSIPNGWSSVKLSDLGEVNRGRSRYRPRYAEHLYGGPYPFVQTGDIKASGGRITCYSQTYSEDGLKQSRLWPEGTLCITIAANIAETGVLNFPACFPDSVIGFIADSEKCNVYFIEYCFRVLRKDIQRQATGSVQDNINLQTLERLRFPIPALSEQRRIASILCRLDEKITLNTQINQTLEQMAQALFKSWFVDFDPVIDNALEACNPIPKPLAERAARRQAMWAAGNEPAPARLSAETRRLFPNRFEKDETLGWGPAGWESRKVLDLFELHRGFDLPTSKREHGSYPVFAAGGHHGTHSEFKMEPPGVITGRSGVIGSVYLSLEKYWPLNTSLYVRNYKVAGPYYAYHFLRRMDLGALNSGSAVPSLNRNYVHSSPALCPPVGLVVCFEKAVSCFFEKIALNNKQSESLSALRDTLLPKLLSGELKLPEAEAAVETALEVEPA
ncbi:restriction endonuclease subunit S [Halomonas sp. LC1]|uniref:restriction endonuclease subunit S n=1 Tax=Halomonas sp. LC1 TaxID=3043733 RepID=UPI0025526486|nr:restriction endonuclease subunit S [Halomonas sp. LC1]MDK9687884.1 restriction endonuclease subunit S [Halomonas sp. LC1]